MAEMMSDLLNNISSTNIVKLECVFLCPPTFLSILDTAANNLIIPILWAFFLFNNSLSGLPVRDLYARRIGNALLHNNSIQNITLQNVSLSSNCLKGWEDYIENTNVLKRLDLSRNYLNDYGAQSLADMFRKNSSVVILSLWQNEITFEGFKQLGDMLMENRVLTEMRFDVNPGAKGERARALKRKLKKVSTCHITLHKKWYRDHSRE